MMLVTCSLYIVMVFLLFMAITLEQRSMRLDDDEIFNDYTTITSDKFWCLCFGDFGQPRPVALFTLHRYVYIKFHNLTYTRLPFE